jgi:hypothetical protein
MARHKRLTTPHVGSILQGFDRWLVGIEEEDVEPLRQEILAAFTFTEEWEVNDGQLRCIYGEERIGPIPMLRISPLRPDGLLKSLSSATFGICEVNMIEKGEK